LVEKAHPDMFFFISHYSVMQNEDHRPYLEPTNYNVHNFPILLEVESVIPFNSAIIHSYMYIVQKRNF
jgi:hypothetical protein